MAKRGPKTKRSRRANRRTRRARARKITGGGKKINSINLDSTQPDYTEINGADYKSITDFFEALTDLERSGYRHLYIYYQDMSNKLKLVGKDVIDFGVAQDIITNTIRKFDEDINAEYKYFYVIAYKQSIKRKSLL